MGNPIICATGMEQDCNGTTDMPVSLPLTTQQSKQANVSIVSNKAAYYTCTFYLKAFCCDLFLNLESQPSVTPKTNKMALALSTSIGCFCLLFLGLGFVFWWRRRYNQQVFFDING